MSFVLRHAKAPPGWTKAEKAAFGRQVENRDWVYLNDVLQDGAVTFIGVGMYVRVGGVWVKS